MDCKTFTSSCRLTHTHIKVRKRIASALGDVENARKYRERFETSKRVPTLAECTTFEYRLLAVAEKMLDGELSYRCGDLKDAFESLRKAVRLEDELPYDEPWGWMSLTRHALGALLESGRVSEAEAVFRKDLGRYPMNLWSPPTLV